MGRLRACLLTWLNVSYSISAARSPESDRPKSKHSAGLYFSELEGSFPVSRRANNCGAAETSSTQAISCQGGNWIHNKDIGFKRWPGK